MLQSSLWLRRGGRPFRLLLFFAFGFQPFQRSFKCSVTTRKDILENHREHFIGRDANRFQSRAVGRVVVQFADVKLASIRQLVRATNAKYAAACLFAQYLGAAKCLHRRGKDFRRARCLRTR